MRLSRFLPGASALLASLACGLAMAQGQPAWPTHPIRIATASAGGGSDFISRLVGGGISASLGQPVVVMNFPAGVQSGELVMKAAPDGHTLLVSGALLWVGPLLRPAPYDPQRDFAPVSILVASSSVVTVTPSLPVNNVRELVAYAKANPGQLNYASPGTGTQAHLAAELFKSMAGIQMTGISYSAAAVRLNDLFSGRVQVAIDDGLMPHVRSGKIKGLAVTALKPSPFAPGLPTVSESGVPGYESSLRTGLFAPAKTPEAVIRRLNQEVVRFLSQPDIRTRLLDFGTEPVGSPPEEMARVMRDEVAKFTKVIADNNITVQ